MMNKEFWKATGIRCLRSFLSVILGAQTGNLTLITDIDWRSTLIAAVSTTFWILIACILAGLPEVNAAATIYALENAPDGDDEEDDEDDYAFMLDEEGDE